MLLILHREVTGVLGHGHMLGAPHLVVDVRILWVILEAATVLALVMDLPVAVVVATTLVEAATLVIVVLALMELFVLVAALPGPVLLRLIVAVPSVRVTLGRLLRVAWLETLLHLDLGKVEHFSVYTKSIT